MMKKINQLLIFTVFFALNVSAQNKKNTTYDGSVTTICSLVQEGDGARVAKDAPLILYMKDSVQNQQMKIVFPQMMRKQMSYDPYAKLVNQKVCITGKISEYNNEPAIIISNENQIKTTSGKQVNKMNSYE